MTVTFSGSVSADHSEVVAAKIPLVNAATLVNNIAQAGELLHTTVQLPSSADITQGSFTVTSVPPDGALATSTKDTDSQSDESSDDNSMLLIIVALTGAVVVIVIALGSWSFIRKGEARQQIIVQVHQLYLLLILVSKCFMSSGCNE